MSARWNYCTFFVGDKNAFKIFRNAKNWDNIILNLSVLCKTKATNKIKKNKKRNTFHLLRKGRFKTQISSINVNCSNNNFIIYLTPVKTQLLQYNLTRDLMLFYHSNKIKA